jgi:ABC-type branched-subunit amino acid transport system substrate-binding protein
VSPAALARAARGPAALLLAVSPVGVLTACSDATSATASPSTVRLDADGAPSPLDIGVVVSLGTGLGQGTEWQGPAEGAQVAAYRYRLGDVDVTIRPADDKGTEDGARQAVRRLVDEGVAGIVVATGGDHVAAALEEADRSGTPVLLPYDASADELPAGAWSTGPDRTQVGAALTVALSARDLGRPLLVDAGGGDLPGLAPAVRLRFRPGGDAGRLAQAVAHRARGGAVDSVVVSGPAAMQAQVVTALEGSADDLPVLLTPEALSPAFSTALEEAGGSPDADLTTVGLDGLDTTTLDPGEAGRRAAGFYGAVRSAASEPDLDDLFDGRPFHDVAGDADARSHDAVVALVTAAARAGSADPEEVRAALAGLTVSAAAGLAGPDLDFRHHAAVAPADVVTLVATTQDPGVAPAADGPRIHWFAATDAG